MASPSVRVLTAALLTLSADRQGAYSRSTELAKKTAVAIRHVSVVNTGIEWSDRLTADERSVFNVVENMPQDPPDRVGEFYSVAGLQNSEVATAAPY